MTSFATRASIARIRQGSGPVLVLVLASAGAPALAQDAAKGHAVVERATLAGGGGTGYESFARAVALDARGTRAFVGAPHDGPPGMLFGSVSVYALGADGWALEALLRPEDPTLQMRFGAALATDTDRLAIGASHDGTAVPDGGAAFVYARRSDGAWEQSARLVPRAPIPDAAFGSALDLQGGLLVVGAPGTGDGTVHTFVRDAAGWSEEAVLEPPPSFSFPEAFGFSLSLSGDRLAVGSTGFSGGGAPEGRVLIYVRDAAGWTLEQQLGPLPEGARFGWSVALDGDRLAVGAPEDDLLAVDSGAAHLFARVAGQWLPEAVLRMPTAAPYDRLGYALDLCGDELLVGALRWTHAGSLPGGVQLFSREGGAWATLEQFGAPAGHDGDEFGCAVALGPERLVIGARGFAHEGRAFVFDHVVPFRTLCVGDGSGLVCPCGNWSAHGAGEGCYNSTGVGARLAPAGSNLVAADDLVLHAEQLPPGRSALLFAGAHGLASGMPHIFGDGLRCTAGDVRRLGVRRADREGRASWGPGLGQEGVWSAGDTPVYQVVYLDLPNQPCGYGMNTTNGLQVSYVE